MATSTSNGHISHGKNKKSGGTSQQQKKKTFPKEHFEEVPLTRAINTYISYAIMIFWGYIWDTLRYLGLKNDGRENTCKDDLFKLRLEWDGFYTRNVFRRIKECFNRPVCGVPGAYIELLDRVSDDHNWTFRNTGNSKKCLNLGSYNYLGFAEETGPCADAAIEAIHQYGAGTNSARVDLGTLKCIQDLETKVAQFIGKPDAIVFGMGFGTNSTNIPALVNKGCLIISDALNHASIVTGAKLSGATIRVFKHNDIVCLERLLREAIVKGQPRTHRPWKKILIIVEGIYSMEGSVPKLAEIVELKKKYKAYLYLDEAHSIGAMGPTGRGVTEYLGVDPADVDIMMGTFTKSFGGCGGYIAANHDIIAHLRKHSHSSIYASAMTAPVALQILTSMKIIMGEDGTNDGVKRITQLIDNSRYFRKRLLEMKFIVYGNEESPVVPIIIYQPGKLKIISNHLRERGIAVVIAGYPATTIVEGRIRICLSAAHTREMIDFVLKELGDIGKEVWLGNLTVDELPKLKND